MTTLKEYKEREEFFIHEFEILKDYRIDVKVNVRQDATGLSYIVMDLYRKNKFITSVESLAELEKIRIVLEELEFVFSFPVQVHNTV